MKLLDTNIFVYAQGGPHPYREPCQTLVAALEEHSSEYNVDTELLQGVLHVYSLRGERPRALRTFDRRLRLFPYPIAIAGQELLVARQIFERYPALSSRDAIHAAVVQTQGLEGIVTTDRAFSDVLGLTAFDPRDVAAGA
ncbi:MAG: type II toxin-antitoxin system VapC family toxin [Chloroflexi bacterium]|nr:type II toxin-antitoxin system VapC family toxin [Chloroflexota bacterium]